MLVITANNQGMSDWLRAVGDIAAAQGFIAVVPDLAIGDLRAAEAVTREAIAMPASNGNGAAVRFNFDERRGTHRRHDHVARAQHAIVRAERPRVA